MAKVAGAESARGKAKATGKAGPNGTPKRAKKPAGKDAVLERLRAELVELASELDAEGLEFLIEQARVHRYNMEVGKLERLGEELEMSRGRSGASATKAAPAAAGAPPRFVAGGDGKTFHLVWKGEYKLFGGDEIAAMLKVAQGGPARLWAWLDRERSDVIGDLGLSGASDPDLARLAALIDSTFVIRKP
ncbi:MAG: hypothetical protein JXA15_00145 [Spirochaetales bacterium]|nr:hypothetical protein [Spirochaetales bacterium]